MLALRTHQLERVVITAACIFEFNHSPLKVRTSLSGAIQLVEGDTISQPPVEPSLGRPLKESARAEIEPRFGAMIGFQDFHKASGAQHCCQLVGRKELNVERKYDGEYRQIHISRRDSQPL